MSDCKNVEGDSDLLKVVKQPQLTLHFKCEQARNEYRISVEEKVRAVLFGRISYITSAAAT